MQDERMLNVSDLNRSHGRADRGIESERCNCIDGCFDFGFMNIIFHGLNSS